jgi:hypothetical protein
MFQAEKYFYLRLRYMLFKNRCRVGKGPYTNQLAQRPSYRKGVTHSTYSAEFENLWIFVSMLCPCTDLSRVFFLYVDKIICLRLKSSNKNMTPTATELSPKYIETIRNGNYKN